MEYDQSSGDRRTRRKSRQLLSFYAETVEQFPPEAAAARTLIIKTHIPSPALQFFARFFAGTLITTVREPRDAITSLMQRFDHKFTGCVHEVSAGAACLVNLSRGGRPLVFRYEDNFYDRLETIGRVASRLRISVPLSARREIYESLRPEAIRSDIDKLQKAGAFGRSATPDSFDPLTQWHPGHIGDRRIRKYRNVLSPEMQLVVLQKMRDYCIQFGYSTRAPAGTRTATTAAVASGITMA